MPPNEVPQVDQSSGYKPCECGCWPTPRDQRERRCRVCGNYRPAAWHDCAPVTEPEPEAGADFTPHHLR